MLSEQSLQREWLVKWTSWDQSGDEGKKVSTKLHVQKLQKDTDHLVIDWAGGICESLGSYWQVHAQSQISEDPVIKAGGHMWRPSAYAQQVTWWMGLEISSKEGWNATLESTKLWICWERDIYQRGPVKECDGVETRYNHIAEDTIESVRQEWLRAPNPTGRPRSDYAWNLTIKRSMLMGGNHLAFS